MTIKIQERDSAQAPNADTDYYAQDSDDGSESDFHKESKASVCSIQQEGTELDVNKIEIYSDASSLI